MVAFDQFSAFTASMSYVASPCGASYRETVNLIAPKFSGGPKMDILINKDQDNEREKVRILIFDKDGAWVMLSDVDRNLLTNISPY